MYISFDKNKMHVQVICGILENYKPTEEVKAIHKKVEKLKKELHKFQSETVIPSLREIEELIEKENQKVKVKEDKQT